MQRLFLRANVEMATLPVGLGRLSKLEQLDLLHCSRLTTLNDLQLQKGLQTLLAHLAQL